MTEIPTTGRTGGDVDSETVFEVEDLHTRFELPTGSVRAVDGVSFALRRGTTLGIVGESGSGKTVLSRSAMRLRLGATAVTTGSVRFCGEELLGIPPNRMRRYWGEHMAMVFQDPMTSLNPVIKIGRQMTEHVRFHLGIGKSEARTAAIELLRRVHIPEPERRFDSYPHEMSGGMRQRVCIAIALACGPQVLFADEPTTALDVTVQHEILNLLGLEQRDRAMAMVLITHDLSVAAGRTDEIAVMYGGQFVEKAPTAAIFTDVRMPYTEALLGSVPRTTNPTHTRLRAIAGRPPDLVAPPKGCRFSPRCPYAQPRCHEEEPPLTAATIPGHVYRCWYPVGSPENREAWERNLAAELPQTLAAAGRVGAATELEALV